MESDSCIEILAHQFNKNRKHKAISIDESGTDESILEESECDEFLPESQMYTCLPVYSTISSTLLSHSSEECDEPLTELYYSNSETSEQDEPLLLERLENIESESEEDEPL